MIEQKELKKLCNFYVSDMHLGIMLLPYLSEKIKEKNTIYTFLNTSISEELKKILDSIQLKEENKKVIEEINWNKKEVKKYSEFEKEMDNTIKENKNIIFIITGEESYREICHRNIKHFYEKRTEILEAKKLEITIIDCYEVMQFNNNIQQILQEHDKILNTSGEKEIEEVFEGFERKPKKLAQ